MTMPVMPTTIGAMISAGQYPMPSHVSRNQAQNAPSMYCAPCVKLMMFNRPKITARPRLSIA